jgi:GT2 family glycosyltransferase/glycosyltransferase involved in cell wall biosynthesis
MDLLRKTWHYLRVFGLRATLVRTVTKVGEMSGWRRPAPPELGVLAADFLSALSRDGGRAPDDHPYVDIVVPIFNGLGMLRRCIESVLRNSSKCRLILIDDASTDTAVAPYLAGIGGIPDRDVTVEHLANDVNVGFVATVNRGLSLATHNVVILNTDTEVPPRWLERLMAPMVADPEHVASVTPMSNSATVCSFPLSWQDNDLLLGMSPGEIDSIFERRGSAASVEIPSGVGFCMAMSRTALTRVGLFDQATFGRGYGEENDWCARATRLGFRHVATANLFVHHQHGGSFAAKERTALQEKHQLLLRKRYPELFAANASFARLDPLAATRLSMALHAVSDGGRQTLLFLDVDVPPGVPSGAVAYRDWLARSLARQGYSVVVVTYDPGGALVRFRVVGPSSNYVQLVGCVSNELESQIGDLIDVLAPAWLLVTNLIWYPHAENVAAQVVRSKVPYLVFAHDFCSVCPSWFLVNKEGKYCGGETQMPVCDDCLPHNNYADFRDVYPDFIPSVSRWRTSMGTLLMNAEHVVCFSDSTLQVLTKVYPTTTGIVIPHVVEPMPGEGRRVVLSTGNGLTVAMIGAMQYIKGAAILRVLVELSRSMRLPLQFVVIGAWSAYGDGYASHDGRLRVTGAYRREDLPRLLEQSGASLVMIPSICPETYSYTTSEAMLLGYPVVCFDLGAPAERVRAFDCGMVVEDVSAEGMLVALKHILEHPDLIKYWSSNTARYVPSTEAEHINAILRCLSDGSRGAGERLVTTEETSA